MTDRKKLLCECGNRLDVKHMWVLKTTPLALVSRTRICKCGNRFVTYEIKKDVFLQLLGEKEKVKNLKDILSALLNREKDSAIDATD